MMRMVSPGVIDGDRDGIVAALRDEVGNCFVPLRPGASHNAGTFVPIGTFGTMVCPLELVDGPVLPEIVAIAPATGWLLLACKQVTWTMPKVWTPI